MCICTVAARCPRPVGIGQPCNFRAAADVRMLQVANGVGVGRDSLTPLRSSRERYFSKSCCHGISLSWRMHSQHMRTCDAWYRAGMTRIS